MFKAGIKFLIYALIFPFVVKGQINLVPNPSFEQYSICPDNTGQIYYAVPWLQPTLGTPDYFNSCVSTPLGVPLNFYGYQMAHTGNAYSGFFGCILMLDSFPFTNYREYAEVKLGSPLQGGVEYFISFYVSLADSVNYSTDAVSACFTMDTIKNDTGYFLGLAPQIENTPGNFLTDKSGWTKITGSFIAQGGEEFLTIGNFKSRTNTNTVFVSGGSSNASQSDWSGGYYYLDDVCVSTDSMYAENWTGIIPSIPNQAINIYPNPSNGYIVIENVSISSKYIITDNLGQEVKAGVINQNMQKIDVSQFPKGIYYFIINNIDVHKIIIDD